MAHDTRSSTGEEAPATPGRRCRPRPVPLSPGAFRPSDMLAAFFVTAIGFLLAGAVVAMLTVADLTGWYGRWLALHLLLLGGVSQLVLGAGQFFTTAFLATDPPPRRTAYAQLATWSGGTAAVAVGVPIGSSTLVDVGAIGLAAGLALFAASLRSLERRSLQQARWAVRWYYACAISLGVGALIGVLMARGVAWSHGDLLAAHLTCNLAGWLGIAIVGTLHTFYPSLTHTQLHHPRLQGPTFAAWTGGVAILAAGFGFDVHAAILVGWLSLTLGAGLLAVNVVGCTRSATLPLGLPARLVGSAQGFLVAAMLFASITVIADGSDAVFADDHRPLLTVLLLAGWIGLTVAGSLLHLLTVLQRVRHLRLAMPAPRVGRDRWAANLAVGVVALLAVSRIPGIEALGDPATLLAVAVTIVLGAQILTLAVRAVRPARRRRT